MATLRFTSFAVSLGILMAPQQTIAAPGDGLVWHWFSKCTNGYTVELQVLLDGAPVHKSSFPACPMLRTSILPEPKQRILEFTLPSKAHRRIRAPANLAVEGNIWEAGGEADGLLLGISLAAPNKVLLNTLHIAEMGKTARSQIAPGLVVITSMAKQ